MFLIYYQKIANRRNISKEEINQSVSIESDLCAHECVYVCTPRFTQQEFLLPDEI